MNARFAALIVIFSLISLSIGKVILPSESDYWFDTRQRAQQGEPIRLQFALHQRNLDWLETTILEVSDPTSPSYGKHLSIYELADKIAPHRFQIEHVLNWLSANGIQGEVPLSRDWIIADTTVSKAEELLNCKITVHRNIRTGREVIRAKEYTIPQQYENIIDFVAGLNTLPFDKIRLTRTFSVLPESVDPQTLYDLYSVTVPTSATSGSSQAVVEFNNANFSPSDLDTFFKTFQPSLEGQAVEQIYGVNNPNGIISVEANLDVQYIMAMGAFVNTSDYVMSYSLNILDSFLDYTYVVGNQTNPPLVHSISWGEYGGKYDNLTDQRINNEFQKMGVRGISILLASGDNGVGCNDKCTSEEFDFPSSPYLTMVGASQLESSGTETGATLSAGGFSKDFYQPSYQSSAVNTYLNSGVTLPPSSQYYSSGRAYPDVAAIGMSVKIINRGKTESVDGTSCSAPIFAGIVSLLNNERIAAGKSPLGFLNPWLYQNPSMFTDIVSGSNPYECCQGFEATEGWDPVTGLGTPIYTKMLNSALSLP